MAKRVEIHGKPTVWKGKRGYWVTIQGRHVFLPEEKVKGYLQWTSGMDRSTTIMLTGAGIALAGYNAEVIASILEAMGSKYELPSKAAKAVTEHWRKAVHHDLKARYSEGWTYVLESLKKRWHLHRAKFIDVNGYKQLAQSVRALRPVLMGLGSIVALAGVGTYLLAKWRRKKVTEKW